MKKKKFSPDERQMKILKQLHSIKDKDIDESKLLVNDLARKYDVHEVVIRQDLAKLKELILNLDRFQGGARLLSGIDPYERTFFGKKMKMQVEEKRLMAMFIEQKYIEDGDYLLICPGSTTTLVAREIAYSTKQALRCASNSLTVAQEFVKFERSCELAMIGGLLYRRGLEFVQLQPDAFKNNPFGHFHGDFKAIMTASGFSLTRGATNSPEIVKVKRQYINAASKIYMILDYSKFTKKAPRTVTYCGLQDDYDEEEDRNWLEGEKDFWLITMPPIKRESEEEAYNQFMSIIDQYKDRVKPEDVSPKKGEFSSIFVFKTKIKPRS